MQKANLEQYQDKSIDFLFWIKSYIASKIYKLKSNKGVKDFNREFNYNLVLNSSTVEELRENSNKVAQLMSGLRNYSTPLIALYNHVVDDKKIDTLKKIDTNYINSYTRKNKVSSNYYVQLRSLFKFIDSNMLDDFKFDIGFLKDGTKAKLPVKMTNEKTYNFLEPKDFEKFVKSIKNYKTNHPNPFLLKLMVKFFCFGGFRAEEVQHIKQEDISFKEMDSRTYMQVYIMGKGNKERFVYILFDLIKEEYEKYQEVKKDKEHKCEYLFYTRDFKIFSSKRIYDIVKDFYKKSGIEVDNFSCHTLRRTYSSILHFMGIPYDKIGILLGHTSEDSTEYYVFPIEEKSREVPSLFKL